MSKRKRKNPLREKLIAAAQSLARERGHQDPGTDDVLTPQEALAAGMNQRGYVEYLDSLIAPACKALQLTLEEFRALNHPEQTLAILIYCGKHSPRKAALACQYYRYSSSIGTCRKLLKTLPVPLYIAAHKAPTSRGAEWFTHFLTDRKPTEKKKQAKPNGPRANKLGQT